MLLQYKKIFEKALRYWGIAKQLGMVREENTEINVLLNKAERYDYNLDHELSKVKTNGTKDAEVISIKDWLIEECADGKIMLNQLAIIVGAEEVHIEIDRKIDRLRDKLYMIDQANKKITCLSCKKSFELDQEIPEDIECEHCRASLYEVGFTWKVIDSEGPTYTLDLKPTDPQRSFALARYGERALPDRGDYGYKCASSYQGPFLSDEKSEELSKLFQTKSESEIELDNVIKEFHRERRRIILETIKEVQEKLTTVTNNIASASTREEENKLRPRFNALREIIQTLEPLRARTLEEF